MTGNSICLECILELHRATSALSSALVNVVKLSLKVIFILLRTPNIVNLLICRTYPNPSTIL